MQELFPGYFRPTKEEFSTMWQECIFVFDANVLLNIYRYTPQTREELFDIFEQLKERIWLPHQAMLEYFENREEVISQQYSIGNDLETALSSASKIIEAKYKRGHPFANTGFIAEIIKEAIEKINASIAEAQSKYPNLIENDYLLGKITRLFNCKVGSKYPPKRIEEIHKEFEQRYRLQIPPGYRDKNPKKEGLKKYGDGILWFQLIDYAKSQGKTIILTTDDQKDDWWQIGTGKTLGPRPELVEEIHSKAGIAFYMYSASQFMIHAKEFLGFQVKQEAIDEVRDVGQQDKNYDVMSESTDNFGFKQRVQELFDSPAHQMMLDYLNSPAHRMMLDYLNSPAHRMMRDYLNSPAHRMMRDYLNSPDFEMLREAQLDQKNYQVGSDEKEKHDETNDNEFGKS